MRIFASIISSLLAFGIYASLATAQSNDGLNQPTISAKQLVVMIDGRFPTTGALTSGAGIVVGRKGGLVYIATAGHVVEGLTDTAIDLKIQFLDRPGDEIEATLWPSNFDKGVDIAVLVVPEDRVPETITSLDVFPAARITEEISKGESVFLFGQPQGRLWSGNESPERVVVTTSTSIEVNSNTAVPGMSGGAALDDGSRIVGLIVDTQDGKARAIPVKYLGELMDSSGFPFDIISVDGVVPVFIPGASSEKELLSIALSSGRFDDLSRFPRNERTALLAQRLLLTDKDVRDGFFTQLQSEEALAWLGEIVNHGLDPNFVVDDAEGRSALYYALRKNNIGLAIALLENGASPHAFQKLWGNERSSVSFLDPLGWLSRVSASEGEKRELALAMANAGLAVLVESPSGEYEVDGSDFEDNLRLLEYLGIPVMQVDALQRDKKRCALASDASEVDWCDEMVKVPNFIENITGAGDDLSKGFYIGKLIGVYDDRMYFFALGAYGNWLGNPVSLAVFSRGRNNVEIYRFSRGGAGLGHCSRLRARAAGREVGDYIDADRNAYCWRQFPLSRTFGEAGYGYYWEQSYYCRNGTIRDGTIREIAYPNSWSEVPEESRMKGRVPC